MEYYRLKKGDTLLQLSIDRGIPLCMLLRANNEVKEDAPGTLICIPLWYYCIDEAQKYHQACPYMED